MNKRRTCHRERCLRPRTCLRPRACLFITCLTLVVVAFGAEATDYLPTTEVYQLETIELDEVFADLEVDSQGRRLLAITAQTDLVIADASVPWNPLQSGHAFKTYNTPAVYGTGTTDGSIIIGSMDRTSRQNQMFATDEHVYYLQSKSGGYILFNKVGMATDPPTVFGEYRLSLPGLNTHFKAVLVETHIANNKLLICYEDTNSGTYIGGACAIVDISNTPVIEGNILKFADIASNIDISVDMKNGQGVVVWKSATNTGKFYLNQFTYVPGTGLQTSDDNNLSPVFILPTRSGIQFPQVKMVQDRYVVVCAGTDSIGTDTDTDHRVRCSNVYLGDAANGYAGFYESAAISAGWATVYRSLSLRTVFLDCRSNEQCIVCNNPENTFRCMVFKAGYNAQRLDLQAGEVIPDPSSTPYYMSLSLHFGENGIASYCGNSIFSEYSCQAMWIPDDGTNIIKGIVRRTVTSVAGTQHLQVTEEIDGSTIVVVHSAAGNTATTLLYNVATIGPTQPTEAPTGSPTVAPTTVAPTAAPTTVDLVIVDAYPDPAQSDLFSGHEWATCDNPTGYSTTGSGAVTLTDPFRESKYNKLVETSSHRIYIQFTHEGYLFNKVSKVFPPNTVAVGEYRFTPEGFAGASNKGAFDAVMLPGDKLLMCYKGLPDGLNWGGSCVVLDVSGVPTPVSNYLHNPSVADQEWVKLDMATAASGASQGAVVWRTDGVNPDVITRIMYDPVASNLIFGSYKAWQSRDTSESARAYQPVIKMLNTADADKAVVCGYLPGIASDSYGKTDTRERCLLVKFDDNNVNEADKIQFGAVWSAEHSTGKIDVTGQHNGVYLACRSGVPTSPTGQCVVCSEEGWFRCSVFSFLSGLSSPASKLGAVDLQYMPGLVSVTLSFAENGIISYCAGEGKVNTNSNPTNAMCNTMWVDNTGYNYKIENVNWGKGTPKPFNDMSPYGTQHVVTESDDHKGIAISLVGPVGWAPFLQWKTTATSAFSVTTQAPTAPTEAPSIAPTATPTKTPTEAPTTAAPTTVAPTTAAPTTVAPTTAAPTAPTQAPTAPTLAPTAPTEAPTAPTGSPTAPTEAPTKTPTQAPSIAPTKTPTKTPTGTPTVAPTKTPTDAPTVAPTKTPTDGPTATPTKTPTGTPTTGTPTDSPTKAPTDSPTKSPTKAPTDSPTPPTAAPTAVPTSPTSTPTMSPTVDESWYSQNVAFDTATLAYEGEVKLLAERAYGLSIGVCIGFCTEYAEGVSITSFVSEGRRASSITFVLQITGISQTTVNGYISSANTLTSQRMQTTSDSLKTTFPQLANVAFSVGDVYQLTGTTKYVVLHGQSSLCGDGVMEAIPASGKCPMVGSHSSTSPSSSMVAETCDTASSAGFGKFLGGCGNASSCALVLNTRVELAEVLENTTDGRIARSRQLQYGLTTADMASSEEFNPYKAFDVSNFPARINPCLYSSQLVLADGTPTVDFWDAAGCVLTDADIIKFTSLANCYDSKNVTGGSSLSDLGDFGRRLDENNNNFVLYGHKCQWPASIRIDSVAGGNMTWETTDQNLQGKIVPSASGQYEGLYDLCFRIDDPSWPAVHPSSFEYIPQITRMQYQIVCDPLDQETAFPDQWDDCETNTDSTNPLSFRTSSPRSHSHKCTRLGNRKNPCSNVNRIFELYSCDGSSCESLEDLASEYSDRYKSTTEKGIMYSFEHDSDPSKNRFGCHDKQFSNVDLSEAEFLAGDTVDAESKYICSTGGQDTPCTTGEMVHHVDTCSSGIEYRDNLALEDKLKTQTDKWKNLTSLHNCKFDNRTISLNYHRTNTTLDCVSYSNETNCEVYKFYRDLQQYPIGCSRRLKIRVKKGVSGQVVLRVIARTYNTAIYENDKDKGYTYWSSSMVPVSIAAKVKPIDPITENLGRDSHNAFLEEKGSIDLFGGTTSYNPFEYMVVNRFDEEAESTRAKHYSRSTRAHLEVIECTETDKVIGIENDTSVPRFRLSTNGKHWNSTFGGDYNYRTNFDGMQYGTDPRVYELPHIHSYEAPTISELKLFQPRLTLRAAHEDASAWWKDVVLKMKTLDSYHEGYSNEKGLCFVNRLFVFEPSSCDYSVTDSKPYWLHVKPVNSDARPSVAFEQTTLVWEEDTTVPLKVSVKHPGSDDDSKLWYFSHVEIEDLNTTPDKMNGGDFDLFSYGYTVGDSGANSDTVSASVGINKKANTVKIWRSFANRCTRWLFEKGSSYPGGFLNSSMQGVASDAGFASAEECLNHARQQGESIWGTPNTTQNQKNGIYLRPYRKMTKNIRLRVKVFMYDGDAFGWHMSDASLVKTAESAVLSLLHVPMSTRYDQYEINQQTVTNQNVGENDMITIALGSNNGEISVPLPYRNGNRVCTYVHNTTDLSKIDDIDRDVEYHDADCNDDSECIAKSGYRQSCKSSGADSTRARIETLVIFDESDAPMHVGQTYLDGSPAWEHGKMSLPEEIAYQPAGNNTLAAELQWYRIIPCDTTPAPDRVYWCDDLNSQGLDTKANDTDLTGICNLAEKGQAADTSTGPSMTRHQLYNSLSIDKATKQIFVNQSDKFGYTENFWIVQLDSQTRKLEAGSLCLQGRSDFNTEDDSYAKKAPLRLRIIVVLLDEVVASSAVDSNLSTWSARSKSNATQGAFTVNIEHSRQLATATVEAKFADTSFGSFVISNVEERNDATRTEVEEQRDWGDVSTMLNGTLDADIDCTATHSSDTFCADNIRFTETNRFHDQHIGRVEIKGYFQKTCAYNQGGTHHSADQSTTWHNAGGLFDVYVQPEGQSMDTVKYWSESQTSNAVSQEFDPSLHGEKLSSGFGSQCNISFDDGRPTTASNLRSSSCHIRVKSDLVGHNTVTWSDTILNRVIENRCYLGAGSIITCPNGLDPRVIASNLRFRLPHRWSNCLLFKFVISVSNDDRVKPASNFGTGTNPDAYKTTETVYVVPKPMAERPIMWLTTDLSDTSGCLGDSTTACQGREGIEGFGDSGTEKSLTQVYKEIDEQTNLDGSDGMAMAQVIAVAGYRFQVRGLFYSQATDVFTEYNRTNTSTESSGYGWDSTRETYQVSGETIHITVESKYDKMVNGSKPQQFCLWMCPENTQPNTGCAKSKLVRVKPLPEKPINGIDNYNFEEKDVNCQTCAGISDSCIHSGTNPDGTPKYCFDDFRRDATLEGCPTYSTATPYHNPGSRYSFKCTKAGECTDMYNLYVQYPVDQIADDVLEISAVSRADWRGAAGYKRTRVSMNVLIKPSMSISEVGFAIDSTENCDPSSPGVCDTGFYGPPLQPQQSVSIAPLADVPITVNIRESDLHGYDLDKCDRYRSSTDTLSNEGSNSSITTSCGMRFPVNFQDSNLLAVAPIGVKFTIEANDASLNARQVAQALRMLCTLDSLEATMSNPADCIEEMTALLPSGTTVPDENLLRFQSITQLSQPNATTRTLDWSNFVASVHPASHLSWRVGEQMSPKEMTLVGRNKDPYSADDYSFNNSKCEPSRFFQMGLTHQAGYSENIVASARSLMTVNVEDDDFYGKVQLAAPENGFVRPLADLGTGARLQTLAKHVWTATVANNDFTVYVIRSRLRSESDTAEKRKIKLKAMRVWVQMDLDTLNPDEFKVKVERIHGKYDQFLEHQAEYSGNQVVAEEGIGHTNMFKIDFEAQGDIGTNSSDCRDCGVSNSPCYYYNCRNTAGADDRDVPFQFYKATITSTKNIGCDNDGDNTVKFKIVKVEYTNDAGSELQGNEIDCGRAGARNPLQANESAVEFTQILTVLQNSSDSTPFRVDYAGLSPFLERNKTIPLPWNAGTLGGPSMVTFTETEHTECGLVDGKFECAPRKFRMHLCATLRETIPQSWTTWTADKFSFYTSLKESADAWSKIDKFYRISCPTQAELLTINTAAAPAMSISCSETSSILDRLTQRIYTCNPLSDDYPETPDKVSEYCGEDVPRRLLWTIETKKDSGRDVFKCPTLAAKGESDWKKLPFFTFTTKDDKDTVNLSRRPKLCISNEALPLSLQNSSGLSTCSAISDANCLDLRIQDDEIFAIDGSIVNRDTSGIESDFSEPTWDSDRGRLKLKVSNRYHHAPGEKTLVNVAMGGCEPEREDNVAGLTLDDFWNRYPQDSVENPITSDTTAFGSCDFLSGVDFDATLSNAQTFESLYGTNSAQPTIDEFGNLNTTHKLFGFSSIIDGISGKNTLFTAPRNLGVGGEWNVSYAEIDDRGNTDLSPIGFSAELAVSLERLQQCRNRQGKPVVVVRIDPNRKNTMYSFAMSTTQVRAKRKTDSTFVVYSPTCVEQSYTLSVSNTMYALSGTTTQDSENHIYVDTISYRSPEPDQVCLDANTCVTGLGPNHTCPTASTFDIGSMKMMEYIVNLDIRSSTKWTSNGNLTVFYGLANTSDVSIDDENCYGTTPFKIETPSASNEYNELGVTRTRIIFRTSCLELRPSGSSGFGPSISDAFSTCAADNKRSTDFSFKTRVWGCTNQGSLKNPSASNSGCSLLPDWRKATIAIAYIQNPQNLNYEVLFETHMALYSSFDHRLPDSSYPSKLQRDAWRVDNTMINSQQAVYPIDSMVVASLGLAPSSALEAVMTTAIRQVRLCRFKKPCHLQILETNSANEPCTYVNTILEATHSPVAEFARNPNYDRHTGCTQANATTGCQYKERPENRLPKLTCDRMQWEEFAIKEAQYYQQDTTGGFLLQTPNGQMTNALSLSHLALLFDPTIEGTLLVERGATSAIASSVFGDCELPANSIQLPIVEEIFDAKNITNSVKLTHIMPNAPSDGGGVGVCTCKGQRARQFTIDNGASFPYKSSSTRKVVYGDKYYEADPMHPSSLHKCTWLNSPQHSTSETPLNSVDQFVMSLHRLIPGEDYFFEVNAVQFDHNAFSSSDLTNETFDQFDSFSGTKRRLLVHNDVHTSIPRAAISKLAQIKDDRPVGRRVLSLMLPVSDGISSTNLMPQGAAGLIAEDQKKAIASSGLAGFVINGSGASSGGFTSNEDVKDKQADQSFVQWIWEATPGLGGSLTDMMSVVSVAFDVTSWFGGDMVPRWRASVSLSVVFTGILLALQFACLSMGVVNSLAVTTTVARSSFSKGQMQNILFGDGRPWIKGVINDFIDKWRSNFVELEEHKKGENDRCILLAIAITELGLLLGGYYLLACVLVPFRLIFRAWGKKPALRVIECCMIYLLDVSWAGWGLTYLKCCCKCCRYKLKIQGDNGDKAAPTETNEDRVLYKFGGDKPNICQKFCNVLVAIAYKVYCILPFFLLVIFSVAMRCLSCMAGLFLLPYSVIAFGVYYLILLPIGSVIPGSDNFERTGTIDTRGSGIFKFATVTRDDQEMVPLTGGGQQPTDPTKSRFEL